MRAHHRKEAVSRSLGLEQVRSGKLRVIGYRIRSADFELDPKSKTVVELLEHHICAG